jgi:hypothetical protein
MRFTLRAPAKTRQLVERPDISPEIPEAPAVETIHNTNGSDEAPPSIAESSGQTPSLVAVSASNLPDLRQSHQEPMKQQAQASNEKGSEITVSDVAMKCRETGK